MKNHYGKVQEKPYGGITPLPMASPRVNIPAYKEVHYPHLLAFAAGYNCCLLMTKLNECFVGASNMYLDIFHR